MKRAAVGILGGTFNPVHVGHLRGAIDSRDLLGLDKVLLLPAAQPPLKATPGVNAGHRAAMLDLAIAGITGLAVDRRELSRAGPSYTIETLQELRAELGPDIPLVFIMGADGLQKLHLWHRWQDLLGLANIALMTRPLPALQVSQEVQTWLAAHEVLPEDLLTQAAGHFTRLAQTAFDISSTELRHALHTGANVRFLLPDPVLEYINDHGLYRSSKLSNGE